MIRPTNHRDIPREEGKIVTKNYKRDIRTFVQLSPSILSTATEVSKMSQQPESSASLIQNEQGAAVEYKKVVEYTIAVLGPASTGKSALVQRFSSGAFSPAASQHHGMLETTPTKNFPVETDTWTEEKSHVDLNIKTLSSRHPQFDAKRRELVRDSDGFILVCSILDKATLKTLKEYRDVIYELRKPSEVGVVVVGTHCDAKEEDMQVKLADGTKFCSDWDNGWSVQFFQTNAPDGTNVKTPFETVVSEIRRKRHEKETASDSSSSGAAPPPGQKRSLKSRFIKCISCGKKQ